MRRDPFDRFDEQFDKAFKPRRLFALGLGAIVLNLVFLAAAVAVVIIVVKALV